MAKQTKKTPQADEWNPSGGLEEIEVWLAKVREVMSSKRGWTRLAERVNPEITKLRRWLGIAEQILQADPSVEITRMAMQVGWEIGVAESEIAAEFSRSMDNATAGHKGGRPMKLSDDEVKAAVAAELGKNKKNTPNSVAIDLAATLGLSTKQILRKLQKS